MSNILKRESQVNFSNNSSQYALTTTRTKPINTKMKRETDLQPPYPPKKKKRERE